MKNIDWPLFHRQKLFLLELANTTSFPDEGDRELLDGVINLMDAIQDEFQECSSCDACGDAVPEIVGCPDGREVCPSCFALGGAA